MASGPVAKSKAIASGIQEKRKKHTQGVGLTEDKHLATYYEEDPRDDFYEAKRHVTRSGVDHEGLGTNVPVTPADIQYFMDKRTLEEKHTFDDWKLSTYHPGSDPVRTKFYKKVDPSYFEQREGHIDKDLDILEKLALISLNGPRNEEDLLLLYGISNGRIPVPDWRLHFPSETFPAPPSRRLGFTERLTQGYFNPKRYVKQYPTAQPKDLYTATPFAVGGAYAPSTKKNFSGFMDQVRPVMT